MGRTWRAARVPGAAMSPESVPTEQGPRVAILGTGVAAVMCARTLSKIVKSASVASLRSAKITLCTSRGKLATQMGPQNKTEPKAGQPFFDYGCQYFTAWDPWFASEVERWQSLGLCQALPPEQVGVISEKGFTPVSGDKCWVGNGGMGPMLTSLIQQTVREFEDVLEHVSGFPVEGMKVVSLARSEAGWQLKTKNGQLLGPFDAVVGAFAQHVLTDPFLKSGGEPCQSMLRCLRRVESNQLIPIQVTFEGEPLPMNFTAAHVVDEECLGWICDNSKKPQQSGMIGTPGPQHLTLLSTAGFAEREFNGNPMGYKKIAEREMLAALSRVLGIADLKLHRPRINRINHWEDGLATNTPPSSHGCLFDAKQSLGWCGDFCVLPGVQGAALSGRAMAETLVKYFGDEELDIGGLLPAAVPWEQFSGGQNATMLDIGAFSPKLGIASRITHTDLVPSCVHGYNSHCNSGASGAKGAKGATKGHGDGKGAGKQDRVIAEGGYKGKFSKGKGKKSFFGKGSA